MKNIDARAGLPPTRRARALQAEVGAAVRGYFGLNRRSVIAGVQPLLGYHFNLTVELPLKAIVRGYRYIVIPTSWYNRTSGVSKFKIREMGSRYFFIVVYCYLEKYLSREDYRNRQDLRDKQLQVWSR